MQFHNLLNSYNKDNMIQLSSICMVNQGDLDCPYISMKTEAILPHSSCMVLCELASRLHIGLHIHICIIADDHA